DGWEVLRRIRELSSTPVIMLTASETADDVVRAMRIGADDYVTKPFTVEALESRVEERLQRLARDLDRRFEMGRIPIEGGRLVIDLVRAQVQKDDRIIDLSATEYRLLAFLATQPDIPVLPADILAHVWGPEHVNEPDYVKGYIRLLRRKIEDDPSSPRYLIAR